MLLSNRFVFIHLPKTGGTFVKNILTEHAPENWQVIEPVAKKDWYCTDPNHPTVRDIPSEYRGLPIFGFVRNPWDWYVSMYHFLKLDGSNPAFNIASDFGKKDFKETMLNIFTSGDFKGDGAGIFSWYFSESYGNSPSAIEFLKFERLRDDFISYLERVVSIPKSMADAIREHPPLNVGNRNCYREYYNKELKDLIRNKDRKLIDQFGYTY